MRFTKVFAVPLVLGWLLAGCGGGGGGSSSTGPAAPNPDGNWLSFTVSQPEISGYQGERIPFSVTATSSRSFAQPVNIVVLDGSGSITSGGTVTALSGQRYRADLSTSPTLPSGPRVAYLEVRLCEDDPAVCLQPLPGSPWHVPVHFNMKSTAEAAKRLTLSSASLNFTTAPGEPAHATLAASISGDLVGQQYHIKVVAPGGLVTVGNVYPTKDGFSTSLTSSAGLQVGNYSGRVEVQLCREDATVCQHPVPGSPWILPVSVTVQPGANLSPLAPVAGLGAWSTYQGNAAHTGYVPASFDPSKFSRRWKLQVPVDNFVIGGIGAGGGPGSIAVDQGMVYLTEFDTVRGYDVVALSEATGAEAWRAPLGKCFGATAPAAANGQVYVLCGDITQTYLAVLDQRTGAQRSKTLMFGELPETMAPNAVGTDAYIASSDRIPYLSKFSSLDKQFAWRNMEVYDHISRTPAVDANNLYGYGGGKLVAYSVATGVAAWSIADPDYNQYTNRMGMVVIADGRVFFSQENRLVAFNPDQRTVAWTVKGVAVSEPACANGVVYTTSLMGQALDARSAADGTLLWSTPLSGEVYARVLVTRNLAFVSSDQGTVAVDLGTHQIVWRSSLGGELAISGNGILYIRNPVGTLAAINLQ